MPGIFFVQALPASCTHVSLPVINKTLLLRYFVCLLLLSSFTGLLAQNDSAAAVKAERFESDTLHKKHSPRTATLLSAALPGAGQVYNRRNWWWKVPVIYAAGGALIYGAVVYNNGYNEYRAAYKERREKGVNTDPVYNRYQEPTLQAIRDSYRESRDMCYIGLVAVYALQVMDAAVEAHFFDFNISENVSLNVQPQLNVAGAGSTGGVQFTLKF